MNQRRKTIFWAGEGERAEKLRHPFLSPEYRSARFPRRFFSSLSPNAKPGPRLVFYQTWSFTRGFNYRALTWIRNRLLFSLTMNVLKQWYLRLRFSIQIRFCSRRKEAAWSSGLSQRPWVEVLGYHWDSKRCYVSCFVPFTVKAQYFEPPAWLAGFLEIPDNYTLYNGKPFFCVTKGRRIDHFWAAPSLHFNSLCPKSDQQQFSPNEVHALSWDKVTRINKMITKEKMP